MDKVNLNEQQQAAVSAPDGPALVLAGAGSGKTRVIIERMAWLVEERGVDPRNLLALTFTNRAAAEMKQRFMQRINAATAGAWLGTFHSFGLFVLRREGERMGLPRTFVVFDASDQSTLMKRLVRELPARYGAPHPREMLAAIEGYKRRVETPPAPEEATAPHEETVAFLWQRYQAALQAANAVDFSDLLTLPVRLFESQADVRERYQRRYKHVLIDEYQDTNHAQYRMSRLLTEGHGNIFAVGDEDQGIYAWRGADISNILEFSKDFPKARIFRLERNYRSTQPILDAANALVANNANRLGKKLWTEVKEGAPVRFHAMKSGEEEAAFVADEVRKRGDSLRGVAVLFRINAQSRLLEEAFRMKGVPYRLVGTVEFYGRKEIKDLLAYLRVLVNPNDDESLRRIINVPARGIGAATLERFEEYAGLRGLSFMQVLRETEHDETLPPRARRSALEMTELFDALSLDAASQPVSKTVETLLERTNYRGYLQQTDERDFKTRLENVDEFLSACAAFDAEGKKGVAEFLQDLALLTDAEDYDPAAPAASLMTCHSAKGLEFDSVYLIGLEEGLLPFGSEWETGDVEEERRLCYVAMTRARKELVLTAARSRMLYGRTQDERRISRFISEIGRDRLKIETQSPKAKAKGAGRELTAAPQPTLKTGAKVRHATFGPGTVLYTSGAGNQLRARVRFHTGRTATLLVRAAPLEIIEGTSK